MKRTRRRARRVTGWFVVAVAAALILKGSPELAEKLLALSERFSVPALTE